MRSLVFISFLFVFFSAQAATLDRVVAVVGEEPLLQSDVEELRKELATSPALAAIYQMDPKSLDSQKVLTRMIEEKIISQTAKDLDVKVSDTEVENQVAAIAKQNNITKAQLEASLKREGIAAETYRKNIRSQLERRNVFDRELRRGGGSTVSDAELRALYEKRVGREYKITLASFKAPKNKVSAQQKQASLKSLVASVNSGKKSIADVSSDLGAESMGWLSSDSLNPRIFNAIKDLVRNKAAGPVLIDGNYTVILVEDIRKGSAEGFEKARAELSAQAQGQDFERRFAAWLERKKREMNIVVNK